MNNIYADLALNLPVNQTYQYIVPPHLRETARVGSLAMAPVIKRQVAGCIVELSNEKKHERLKEIKGLLTPDFQIDAELIQLAKWISDYYFCSLGEALACVSFIGFNDCRERYQSWVLVKIMKRCKKRTPLKI